MIGLSRKLTVVVAAVAVMCMAGMASGVIVDVSHYKLGETGATGTEPDSIDGNNMLLVAGTHAIGAPAPGAAGSTGSLDLDGSTRFDVNNWITAGLTGNDYRISGWVNPDLAVTPDANGDVVWSDGHGGAGALVFQANHPGGNTSGFGLAMGGAGGFWNAGPTVIVPGTWYFVELERNASVVTLKVDGVDQGLADPGIGTLAWVNGAALGDQALAGGFTWDGQLDAVTYTTVPEPASLALLGLGGLMMLRRRRA